MNHCIGRYVYGASIIAFGICAFVSHDISNWLQLKVFADAAHSATLTDIVGTIEILGGLAILWPQTTRVGAIALGALYFIFALITVQRIFAHPLAYDPYGNVFEISSFVAGAMLLYAGSFPVATPRSATIARIGYYALGVSVMSFALEQLFYLNLTASAVPTWCPPGQMFWAIATTVFLALGSVALLTGFKARLASILNTAMFLGFGVLVWIPTIYLAPHTVFFWTEGIETLGIAGTSWLVAELLHNAASSRAERNVVEGPA